MLEYPFSEDRNYSLTQKSRVLKVGKKRGLKLPSDVSIAENLPTELIPPDSELGMPVELFTLGVFEREMNDGGTAGLRWKKGHAGLHKDSVGAFKRTDELEEADRMLMEHPDGPEGSGEPVGGSKQTSSVNVLLNRGRPKRPMVTWLRPTQYISSEINKQGQFNQTPVEGKMGLSVMSDPTFGKEVDTSRAGQIKAIEKTFNDVHNKDFATLKHPTNKNLTVKEVFPFVPDFEHWGEDYSIINFPEDPASTVKVRFACLIEQWLTFHRMYPIQKQCQTELCSRSVKTRKGPSLEPCIYPFTRLQCV